MSENIIITPGSGTIDFNSSLGTDTTFVIESGSLKFKRSTTTIFTIDNTYPNFRVSTNDGLYVINTFINNYGSLINSTGWLGNRQPTGAQGSQGAVGSQGAQGSQGAGGAQGNISPSQILDYEIPLPPIEVQEEIVRELEQYQKIIDGAKQVVDNYKPVIDIDPSWEMKELGEICEILNGRAYNFSL